MAIERIQHRRGSSSAWATANPVLSSGEFGYDETAKGIKMGDGSTPWGTLPWYHLPRADYFIPEDYGAIGDGVADDRAPIQAAINAAYTAGGGTVLLTGRYGWTGDILHRGSVAVRGVASPKVLVTDDGMDRGLIALDATARYRYGQWAAGSVDDNPGGLYDLLIDGNNVGGVTDGLFIMQAVDGYISNCRIIHSAGTGALIDGAQNSLFTGGLIGLCDDGPAVQFKRIGNVGQNAGNVKFDGVYIGTSKVLLHSTTSPTDIWAHDIIFDKCLFENYTGGNDLVHLQAGAFQFDKCVFTNSNNGAVPPPNGCLILVEQPIWPTIPTQATFDSCYLIGGGVNLPHLLRAKTDETVPQIGNYIRFYGSTYLTKANWAVGIDGGAQFSSAVTFDGDVFSVNVTDWYDSIGTAWLHNVQLRTATPRRWEMPDDPDGFLPDPIVTKRKADANDRFRISRDGFLRWFNGTDVLVQGSLNYDSANDEMRMGARWRYVNAVAYRLSQINVAAAGTAVALSGADTAFPGYLIAFTANGATANITLADGVPGQQIQIAIGATTTTGNSVTWPSNIHFRGTPPQAGDGKVLVVNFVKLTATEWYEIGY